MPAWTLLQLRNSVRDEGDYANSSVFTDAFVTDSINKALAEFYDLVSGTFEGFYDKTATAVTVAGTQTVNLPSDFYNLRAIDRQLDAENFSPLTRLVFRDTYSYGGRGIPSGYMLHGGTAPGVIRLWPIPDAVYTLRLTYEPLFTTLAADGDTFDFRNGWEEYVIQSALLRLDAREERPLNDRMALIERAKQRILTSAEKRNSAEPDYLTLHGDFVPWEYVP